MPRERRGCAVCDSLNRPLVCPGCVSSQFVEDRRKQLQLLQKQKEALLAKLNDLISAKQTYREQQLERLHRTDGLQIVKQRAQVVQKQVEKAKEDVQQLRKQNAARRSRIEKVIAQLGATRTEMVTNHFPTLLRYQQLTYSHVSSMLLREQRSKLRHLLDIMPVRINALRPGGGSPIKVTICNLQLPDHLTMHASLWHQPQALRALSAALGYLMLFLDLVAVYMGGPLLTAGSFRSSTSSIWTPQSFWNRDPMLPGGVLPLYVNEALTGNIPNPFAMSVRVRPSGPTLGFPLSLSRIASSAPRGDGEGARVEATLVKQRHAALKLSFELLQRSLSCFLQDKAAALNLQLPTAWSPFAWLVIFCAVIKRDARSDGVIVAASNVVAEALGSGTGPEGLSHLLSNEALAHAAGPSNARAMDGDDDEVDADGWDMVRVPFLPPPPSQPDEVEHWTRAMFTDAQRNAATAPIAIPGAAMPVERIRSLFSI